MTDSAPTPDRRLGYGVWAYAVLGLGWILASDALVSAVSNDPAWILAAQRWKGLLFVVATAAGLGLLVRSALRHFQQVRQRARQHEWQARELFDRHPQPMWVYDTETLAFLRVNEAARQRYGYTEAEFLQLTPADLRPRDALPGFLQSLDHPLPRRHEQAEVRHRTRNGEPLVMRLSSHEVAGYGRPARLVMAQDVTDAVHTRQALQRQEAQFRQLHHSLGEVLWLVSPDGRHVIYVSPAFATVYGRPVEDFERDVGVWLDAVHPDDRAQALASHGELRRQGQCSCEYRICRPDGGVRWIADRKKLVLDAQGCVVMIGGIAEDITAAKQRDAALALSHEALERRVAERTAELERVNAELEAFARTAAHDLKSPLNAVAGYSGLLRLHHEAALGPQGSAMLARIETSALQMATLVDDLLALSRVQGQPLHSGEVDLAALARELIDALRAQEPARQVAFEAPQALCVEADPGLARSLLSNLLGNAWKFTADNGAARIRLSVQGHEVCIQDNGCGFDAQGRESGFRPFERFHTAAQFGGTGIGLVTCERIVQRHGGRLRVQSRRGQGTEVRFTLAAPARAAPPSPPTEAKA